MKYILKQFIRKGSILLLFCLILIGKGKGQSIGDKITSKGLWYKITSLSPDEAAVTSKNSSYPYWKYGEEEPPESITLPTYINFCLIVAIDQNAFYGTKITNIRMGSDVKRIGESAFEDCKQLQFANLNNVTDIENLAFSYCTSLEHMYLDKVKRVGAFAFSYCYNMDEIRISHTVERFPSSALYKCRNLQKIIVSEYNPYFKVVDNILFSKKMDTLKIYPPGKSDTSYIIPESVSVVDEHAFNHCENLESISLPRTIKNLKYDFLENCTNLKKITVHVPDPNDIDVYNDFFQGIDTKSCVLEVPVGSKEMYEKVYPWKNFKIIKEVKGVGMEDLYASFVRVFPNPSNGDCYIEQPFEKTSLSISTQTGQLIRFQELQKGKNKINIESPGIYFLHILGKEIDVTKKIIVK